MYALYGHPRYFKFKEKYQQYSPCFQTIFPFLMAMFETYLLSSKIDHDIFLSSYVPSLCFLAWILLTLCVSIFLLSKVSLNSLNSVTTFTLFPVQDYLPSIYFMKCIFDFNPTKFFFRLIFHFTNNVLLLSSKNFEFLAKLQKSNKCLCLKNSS